MSYRSYDAVNCKELDVEALSKVVKDQWTIVSVDDAKRMPYAAIYTVNRRASRAEEFLQQHQVFRWRRPWQEAEVIEMLKGWQAEQLQVVVEPSGSYGAGFVERIQKADGLELRQMSGKKTRDSKENYDNVPSMHDAKATDVMARVHFGGGSTPWRSRDKRAQKLKAASKRADRLKRQRDRDRQRLEAELGSWWPELDRQLPTMSTTLLKLVVEFGPPRQVAEQSEEAKKLIRRASRRRVGPAKTQAIIEGAKKSAGAQPCRDDVVYLKEIAGKLLELKQRIREAGRRIDELIEGDEVAERIAQLVGPAATASLVGEVGDPADFPAAAAYQKAAGLNLTEDTSGRTGQHNRQDDAPPMRISKRGSSRARKYLYMAAQRHIQDCPIARAWHQHKVAQHTGCDGAKKIALVAMMRKLIGAVYHVGRGADYDGSKLFDVERLVDKGYLPKTAI